MNNYICETCKVAYHAERVDEDMPYCDPCLRKDTAFWGDQHLDNPQDLTRRLFVDAMRAHMR